MTSIERSPHDLNYPQVQLDLTAFSRVQVGFPFKNYASLDLLIVNDIVSFDHQNETQNREIVLARYGSLSLVMDRFGYLWIVLARYGWFWLVLGHFGLFWAVLADSIV